MMLPAASALPSSGSLLLPSTGLEAAQQPALSGDAAGAESEEQPAQPARQVPGTAPVCSSHQQPAQSSHRHPDGPQRQAARQQEGPRSDDPGLQHQAAARQDQRLEHRERSDDAEGDEESEWGLPEAIKLGLGEQGRLPAYCAAAQLARASTVALPMCSPSCQLAFLNAWSSSPICTAGDLIFYSVLVGRAAMYDMLSAYAAYLAIIAGLGMTLILLALARKALPALPISIALGVSFYFMARFLLEPFVLNLSLNLLYF